MNRRLFATYNYSRIPRADRRLRSRSEVRRGFWYFYCMSSDALTIPEAARATGAERAHGSSDALALARLAASARPLVVFCAGATQAQRLRDEIPWFAPSLSVCLLPDWETLPYDSFSPHHDLVSERLATLYRITRGEFDVAIVPASTALHRLGPPSFLAAYSFFLKQK